MVSVSASESARRILARLESVARERDARAGSPPLAAAVSRIKRFQQRRFEQSYADLLASARYGPAAKFFLDDLYGPSDFSRRDDEFAKVIPALVRLFPAEVVSTVGTLAELHALSEILDSAMGRALGAAELDAAAYAACWRQSASRSERETQLSLLLNVGRALEGFTRKPLLRQALTMMRAPARAAGLQELQQFLERGFDCFRSMAGAGPFLEAVAARERRLASLLFDPDVPASTLAAELPSRE